MKHSKRTELLKLKYYKLLNTKYMIIINSFLFTLPPSTSFSSRGLVGALILYQFFISVISSPPIYQYFLRKTARIRTGNKPVSSCNHVKMSNDLPKICKEHAPCYQFREIFLEINQVFYTPDRRPRS